MTLRILFPLFWNWQLLVFHKHVRHADPLWCFKLLMYSIAFSICESMLGLHNISCNVDIMKLNFLHKWISLPSHCLRKQLIIKKYIIDSTQNYMETQTSLLTECIRTLELRHSLYLDLPTVDPTILNEYSQLNSFTRYILLLGANMCPFTHDDDLLNMFLKCLCLVIQCTLPDLVLT